MSIQQTDLESAPYLTVLGAPPLRFERPIPPPDVVTRPAAAAPPIPALSPTESTVAQANAAAVQSTTPATRPEPAPREGPANSAAPTVTKPAPPSILPDDTRPTNRPEDVLPYFQIPGAARSPGDVKVIGPMNISNSSGLPVPPSSATYTQTPK